MPIVFSAITPHPLLLIPNIGKSNLSQLKATQTAFDKLKAALEKSMADTLLIISPHGRVQKEAFGMNLCPDFSADFEEFGDFATRFRWPGNVGLAHRLKEALETSAPLQLLSEAKLDYGTSVPLSQLVGGNTSMKLIPLYYSGHDIEAQYEFGKHLHPHLQRSNENIAVIASGDLSHRLDKGSPGGYSAKAKRFDTKVLKYLKEKNTQALLDLDKDLIVEAGECGLKSIMLLLGIMDEINYQPKQLSYEHPFGVGYLAMNLEL